VAVAMIGMMIPSVFAQYMGNVGSEGQTGSYTLEEALEIQNAFNKLGVLETNLGSIIIEFFPHDAPNHVVNFVKLTESGFYDGTLFHRIIPGFMIQGGDPNTVAGEPNTWGTGGPDKKLDAEFNSIKHNRGIVSMARSADPNSAGSQFFIVHKDSNFLDGEYTVFGRIATQESFETLDKIVAVQTGTNDRPVNPDQVKIIKSTIVNNSQISNLLELNKPERIESILEPEPEPTVPEPELGIASFVDQTKDPQHYIDRYNNEPAYKEWFDENYSQYSSIYEAVGLEEPIVEYVPEPIVEIASTPNCGTELVNGICPAIQTGVGTYHTIDFMNIFVNNFENNVGCGIVPNPNSNFYLCTGEFWDDDGIEYSLGLRQDLNKEEDIFTHISNVQQPEKISELDATCYSGWFMNSLKRLVCVVDNEFSIKLTVYKYYDPIPMMKQILEKINDPEYIPEPIMESKPICGDGTESVNGICQVIQTVDKSGNTKLNELKKFIPDYYNYDDSMVNDEIVALYASTIRKDVGGYGQFIIVQHDDNDKLWDGFKSAKMQIKFIENVTNLSATCYEGWADEQNKVMSCIKGDMFIRVMTNFGETELAMKQTLDKIDGQLSLPGIGNSKGGGCLIATATYGSEMALEVQQLRELRDNALLNTESGTQFMQYFNDVYYSFSPVISDYERENPLFKEAVKLAITPLISSLSILNHVDMDSEREVLGYGISLIILNLGMYLAVPAVVIVGIKRRI
jgi:cyclophilin family peptidyl-prolyl cis-trans isomerase